MTTKQPMVAATYNGIKIPPSPFLTDAQLKLMSEGHYQSDEIAGALRVVRPGDRVLEIGAGLGVIGAAIAKGANPEKVLSFEANPDLMPHITALYHLNSLDDIMEIQNEIPLANADGPGHTSFDMVRDSFRPDVLIVKMAGGELDFLNHANLAGVRAIVVEYHPRVYGKHGAKICKDALRRAGFAKIDAVSTRFVWTCTRPDWAADPMNVPPDPNVGWSTGLRTLKNAVVQPATTGDLSSPSGVMTADGKDAPDTALWRKHRRVNLPFEKPTGALRRLEGRWLWGGVLYRNFAHFVAESQGRLWGIDATEGYLSGIAYIPRRAGTEAALAGFQRGFFDAFGLDLPIHVVSEPTEVEELVVPGQGFGLGAISAGTEPFRTFTHRRFGAGIVPSGPDKLYISRSRLGPSKGALLGEESLEAYLRAEGYTIFHPEQHDIATQIAHYKAARHVIASEGSALHVFAFCGRADQKVAVLCRRRSSATTLIARHLTHFTGQSPLIIDHLKGIWANADSHRKRLAIGEQDFAAVQQDLYTAGFISRPSGWAPLSPQAVSKELGARYVRQETQVP